MEKKPTISVRFYPPNKVWTISDPNNPDAEYIYLYENGTYKVGFDKDEIPCINQWKDITIE